MFINPNTKIKTVIDNSGINYACAHRNYDARLEIIFEFVSVFSIPSAEYESCNSTCRYCLIAISHGKPTYLII